MLHNKKVAFLGAGSMAEAMISGIIHANKLPSHHIIVTNHSNEQKLHSMTARYGIQGRVKEEVAFDEIDILVLAMKPKDAEAALLFIKDKIRSDQVVISVMAGISTSYIEDRLNKKQQVVRAMPNTSSMVRESATGMSIGTYVSETMAYLCKELLGCFGEVYTIEEDQMDLFTGIAGSGPAYFYYLIEHIEQTAIAGGIDEETARQISIQTMLGASKMMDEQAESPSKLRKNVTSPNGTTAAGLQALQKYGGGKAISQAIQSAAKRSRELNKEKILEVAGTS
ncbi:pyrroline-5-carboxylate reductase [Chengkuizengella axinellae]|uniref:Pyrroline-5-carboxylate reductase n=1 Tax=Chengkuizengella axinellae TaxID=3064388 RepID=A0ABT9J3V7_9BACL|nr:pyrroline-5-carboxylate reductase [Chengkuizengella sp. 2205SS18-9]MDP5276291.1 pyrroline-5-carboxylate reductase [Chengkuizengella sp. 2205SS18-9]